MNAHRIHSAHGAHRTRQPRSAAPAAGVAVKHDARVVGRLASADCWCFGRGPRHAVVARFARRGVSWTGWTGWTEWTSEPRSAATCKRRLGVNMASATGGQRLANRSSAAGENGNRPFRSGSHECPSDPFSAWGPSHQATAKRCDVQTTPGREHGERDGRPTARQPFERRGREREPPVSFRIP